MVYSSFGIIALLIHIIINYDVLRNSNKDESSANKTYRHFLNCVMCYYISDTLWGILYEHKLIYINYFNTVIYFITMAMSVFLLTQYVIEYLNEKLLFGKILFFTGRIYFVCELIVLSVNFFYPILFYFDESGVYNAGKVRYINLFIQILLFLMISAYTLFISLKKKSRRGRRYRTIGFYCVAMTIFIFAQIFYPLLPLYAIGYLLGTCIIHTFVLEDEKEERRTELEKLLKREQLRKQELGTVKNMAYTDSLTGVRSLHAYSEAETSINRRIANGVMKEFAVVVFDLNGLKTANDTLGHEAGNRLLKDACRLICNIFKNSPLYRIGGDEFVAILEGTDYNKRKELLLSFNIQIEKNLKNGSVIIAAGLKEFYPGIDRSLNDVFKQADKKMYERKQLLNDMAQQM